VAESNQPWSKGVARGTRLIAHSIGNGSSSMRSPLGIISLAALALCLGARSVAADPTAQGRDTGPCVEVQIGNDRALDFDCLNRQLRLQADRQKMTPPPTAPIGAGSSSTATGAANQAAAQQMMGDAFGKSPHPQRPAPQTFVPALPHAGAH
jgi:hypothetical protein